MLAGCSRVDDVVGLSEGIKGWFRDIGVLFVRGCTIVDGGVLGGVADFSLVMAVSGCFCFNGADVF